MGTVALRRFIGRKALHLGRLFRLDLPALICRQEWTCQLDGDRMTRFVLLHGAFSGAWIMQLSVS